MKKTIFICSMALALALFASCETECKTVTTKNITVLVDATDSTLIDKAKHELRKENFEQLISQQLDLEDNPKCFEVNYDFGIISTHSYYNPTSTALSHTDWGQARNKLVIGWRDFYASHEENLKSLDSIDQMQRHLAFSHFDESH